MKLQAAKTQLKVTILVTLSFLGNYGYSQNFNEYFRIDGQTATNGVFKMPYSKKVFGICYYLDSNNIQNFGICEYNNSNYKIITNLKANNGGFYIEYLPPKPISNSSFAHAYSYQEFGKKIQGRFTIIDTLGNVLVDSAYNKPFKHIFSSFIQKPDSTFLLFGTSTEHDPNGDFYVAHVGKNGEFISDTSFGNTNLAERGYAIAATPDGGFAFTGSRRVTVSGQPYRSKIVVYKFDSLGALEWTNQYGGDFYNVPYQITSDKKNNSIIISGLNGLFEITPDYFIERPYLFQIKNNGDLNWETILNVGDSFSLGYLSNQTIFRNKIYSVGNYYSLSSPVPANIDSIVSNPSFISKLDLNGNELFRRYIFNFNEIPSKHYLYSIEPTPNGGFLLGGTIEGKAPDPVGQYGWIVKTDSLGCVVPGCHLVGVPNPQGQIANKLLVYPNPSQSIQNTWLSFALPKAEAVSIEILNPNGQIVKVQNFGLLPQGNHQIQINVTLVSGIYFIKLQTPTLNETVKLVVE